MRNGHGGSLPRGAGGTLGAASIARHPSYAYAVPLIFAPFLFYAVKAVFDLGDASTAIGAVLAAALGFVVARGRRRRALRVALALALMVVVALLTALADLSVMRRAGVQAETGAAATLPVYSFDAASGNYHAFIAWWTKYVEAWEQVRLATETPRKEGGRHVPIPNARVRFLGGEIEINNLGFRGRDIPPEKGDSYRIFTLGASNTFGQNIFSDSAPWPDVLDRLIAERLACRRPIQVVNAGVNAYDIKKSLARLQEDIAPLGPDMIISYTGWAEIKYILDDLPKAVNRRFASRMLVDLQRGDGDAGLPLGSFRGADYRLDLGQGAHLFLARLDFAVAQVRSSLAGWGYALGRQLGFASEYSLERIRDSELARLYRDLAEEVERQGARLVVTSVNLAVDERSPLDVIGFYASVFHNNQPGTSYLEAVMRGMDLNRELLQELAAGHENTFFVDVAPGLEGEFDQDYYIDIGHFTPEGDRKMAENVYDGIAPLLRGDPDLACRER